MAHLQLVRKMAEGSGVEAYVGKHKDAYVAVQVSRRELPSDFFHALVAACGRSASRKHPEVLAPVTITRLEDGRMMAMSGSITGWTAADILRTRGPVGEGLVLDWTVSTCEALSALHDEGLVHGCLAPRHLHLDGEPASPRIRLFDTTLLHFRGDASHPVGATVVEPEYLSPERASGIRATPACDVWGLGVLMFELLVGRPPFQQPQPGHTRAAVASRPPLPGLPRGLSRWRSVILGCLDPLPSSRFSSPLEVRQALAALA